MALYTQGALSVGYTQDDLEAAPDEVRSATFEQALSDLPGWSLVRAERLAEARKFGGIAFRSYQPEEAEQYMAERGLAGQFTFDRQYNGDELRILADRKSKELKRSYILARAQGGVLAGAGRLGIQLATSFLDPLAIASAFVPVVGEARYGAMLAKAGGALGRAGVRAGVGAVEGAVGAAVVEPLIYAAKSQEQADYALADSMLNIALGGVFGGGLHAVGGAFGDAIRGGVMRPMSDPATSQIANEEIPTIIEDDPFSSPIDRQRIADLDTAIGYVQPPPRENGLSYRPSDDVYPTYRDQQRAIAEGKIGRIGISGHEAWASRPDQKLKPDAAEAALIKAKSGSELTPKEKRFVDHMLEYVAEERAYHQAVPVDARITADDLAAAELEAADMRIGMLAQRARKIGADADAVDAALESLSDEIAIEKLNKLIEESTSGRQTEVSGADQAAASTIGETRGVADAPAKWRAAETVKTASHQTREAALGVSMAQAQSGEPIEVRPLFDRDSWQDAQRRLSDPDQAEFSNPDAVTRADATLAEGDAVEAASLQQQVADMDARLADIEREAGLTGDEAATEFLAGVREQVAALEKEAKESSNHARMLAVCAMRHAA